LERQPASLHLAINWPQKKKTKYSEYYFPADGSEINLVEINKKEDLQK